MLFVVASNSIDTIFPSLYLNKKVGANIMNGCVYFGHLTNYIDNIESLSDSKKLHILDLSKMSISFDEDCFDSSLSINGIPFTRCFDYYLHITLPTIKVKRNSHNSSLIVDICQLLKIGWSNRVRCIHALHSSNIRTKSIVDDDEYVIVGVILDPNHATDTLTRGPVGNASNAYEFRQFWGDRSELRKFPDNSICEAVVWKSNGTITVVGQIAIHLLKLHLSVENESICCVSTQIEKTIYDIACDTNQFDTICRSFDKLSQTLRLIQGLSLDIANVQPISSNLRKSTPYPSTLIDKHCFLKQSISICDSILVPKPASSAVSSPYLQIFITLEQSGKWPDDLIAFRHLKSAFYLQFADALKQQFKMFTVPAYDSLFVIVDKCIFRLMIVHTKEINLLKKPKLDGSILLRSTCESRQLERDIIHRPKLISWLYSLSQQYVAFGQCCRLVKCWICTHMLSGHINDETIELLIAYIFIHPQPFTTPVTAMTAFVRWLHLLSSHNWLTSPLLLNFNDTWTDDQIDSVYQQFIKLRPTLPPMCICTPSDETGARWTRQQPNAMIVHRLARLAECSLIIYERNLLKYAQNDVQTAMTRSLTVYDVIIRLHGRHITRRQQKRPIIDTDRFVDGSEHSYCYLPVIDFDPVNIFVDELTNAFNNVAMFFYDRYGGDVIGVVWKPKIKQQNNEKDIIDKSNIDTIIEDMRKIGHGLVRSIEKVSPK